MVVDEWPMMGEARRSSKGFNIANDACNFASKSSLGFFDVFCLLPAHSYCTFGAWDGGAADEGIGMRLFDGLRPPRAGDGGTCTCTSRSAAAAEEENDGRDDVDVDVDIDGVGDWCTFCSVDPCDGNDPPFPFPPFPPAAFVGDWIADGGLLTIASAAAIVVVIVDDSVGAMRSSVDSGGAVSVSVAWESSEFDSAAAVGDDAMTTASEAASSTWTGCIDDDDDDDDALLPPPSMVLLGIITLGVWLERFRLLLLL